MTAVVLAAALVACSAQQAPPTQEPTTVVDLPVPWTSIDVGPVGVGGTHVDDAEGDRLVVMGAGSDIWGSDDSFHFVYVPLSGDLDIRARVETLDYTHQWAKAGIMVRASTATNAAHGFVGLTPAGAAEFLYRNDTGAMTVAAVRPDHAVPHWVRLQRVGATLIGSASADGERWEEIGRADVGVGESALLGIAVTSRDPQRLAEAAVRQVTVTTEAGTGIDPVPDPISPDPDPSGVAPGWACTSEPLAPAYQPTYFVATTGSDSNDGRTVGAPFRTVQHAARVVQPGDVVWVRGGVYSSNVAFERSGTPGAPIVFESYPGECAIFDGTGQPRLERVQFWNLQYNVFRNFVVRNSPGEGIYLSNASNNVFSHLHVHDNRMSGILSMYGNDNVFAYFVAHDNYDPSNVGDSDGISIASGNGNRIAHCVSFANSDDGVDTWLSTNSVVEYCVSFQNGLQGGDGNGFKAGGDHRAVNTVVRHSVAFGNRTNGFDWNTGTGVTFEQNTSFGNGRYGIVANQGTLRNNLSVANGDAAFSGNASENSQTTNSWNVGISDAGFASTDPNDTAFVTLHSGSAARNAGTPIGLPYPGAAPDLGALHFGQTLASLFGIDLGRALQGFQ